MKIREFLSTLMTIMFVLAVIAYAVGSKDIGIVFVVFQMVCFVALLIVDLMENL